jgi:HYR domain/Secretion system C-terminal sorting domain
MKSITTLALFLFFCHFLAAQCLPFASSFSTEPFMPRSIAEQSSAEFVVVSFEYKTSAVTNPARFILNGDAITTGGTGNTFVARIDALLPRSDEFRAVQFTGVFGTSGDYRTSTIYFEGQNGGSAEIRNFCLKHTNTAPACANDQAPPYDLYEIYGQPKEAYRYSGRLFDDPKTNLNALTLKKQGGFDIFDNCTEKSQISVIPLACTSGPCTPDTPFVYNWQPGQLAANKPFGFTWELNGDWVRLTGDSFDPTQFLQSLNTLDPGANWKWEIASLKLIGGNRNNLYGTMRFTNLNLAGIANYYAYPSSSRLRTATPDDWAMTFAAGSTSPMVFTDKAGNRDTIDILFGDKPILFDFKVFDVQVPIAEQKKLATDSTVQVRYKLNALHDRGALATNNLAGKLILYYITPENNPSAPVAWLRADPSNIAPFSPSFFEHEADVPIPKNLPLGRYHVNVFAPWGEFYETITNNNTGFATFEITASPNVACTNNLAENGGGEVLGYFQNWSPGTGGIFRSTDVHSGASAIGFSSGSPTSFFVDLPNSVQNRPVGISFYAKKCNTDAFSVELLAKSYTSTWQPTGQQGLRFDLEDSSYRLYQLNVQAGANSTKLELRFQMDGCMLIDDICVTVPENYIDPCYQDITPPVVTCPSTPLVEQANSFGFGTQSGIALIFDLGNFEANDNCRVESTSFSPAARVYGHEFPVGNTTVIFTAHDEAGNTATCSRIVTVTPFANPTSTCADNLMLNPGFENGTESYNGTGFEILTNAATAQSGLNAMQFCTTGGVARQNLGAVSGKLYKFQYSAKTGNLGGNILFGIKFLSSSWQVLDETYSSYDSPSGAYGTNSIELESPIGTAFVELSMYKTNAGCIQVDDLCLTSTAIFNPNPCANDQTPPVFTSCPGNIAVNAVGAAQSANANWLPIAAIDQCTLTPTLVGTHPSNSSFPIGTTVVTYTATDPANNTSTCRFNVVVTPNQTNTNCVGNLVINPSFEADLSGWAQTNAQISSIASQVKEGAKSLKLCSLNASARQTFNVVPGRSYQLQYAVLPPTTGTGILMGIKFLAADYQVLDAVYKNIPAQATPQFVAQTIAGVAPVGAVYVEILALQQSANTCGYIDAICLTDGTVIATEDSDIEVVITPDFAGNGIYQLNNLRVSVKNNGTQAIAKALVKIELCGFPNGAFGQAAKLVFAYESAFFDPYNQVLEVNNLLPNTQYDMNLGLYTLTADPRKIIAYVSQQSSTDIDSEPSSSAPAQCQPVQDDEASYTINAVQNLQSSQGTYTEFSPEAFIFPNPAHHRLFIQLAEFSKTEQVHIKMTNLLGNLAAEWTAFGGDLSDFDVQNLQNGVYFLQIEAPNLRTKTYRVLVEHGW